MKWVDLKLIDYEWWQAVIMRMARGIELDRGKYCAIPRVRGREVVYKDDRDNA